MLFACWSPERGETYDDDAKCLDTGWPGQAAARFAERHAGFNGDPFDYLIVHVAEVDDQRNIVGKIRVFEVEVRAEPTFWASEMQEGGAR